jgi:hypothetical protein
MKLTYMGPPDPSGGHLGEFKIEIDFIIYCS